MKRWQAQDCVYVRLSQRTVMFGNLLVGGQFSVVNAEDLSTEAFEYDSNTILNHEGQTHMGDTSEATGEMREEWFRAGKDARSSLGTVPRHGAVGADGVPVLAE